MIFQSYGTSYDFWHESNSKGKTRDAIISFPQRQAALHANAHHTRVNTTTNDACTRFHMSSHVPFLAVRPDDQFSTEIKPRDILSANAIDPTVPMDAPPPLTPAPPKTAVARVPRHLRFPLICVISFGLSFGLHTLTSEISGYQLASASRHATENWQIGALVAWKLIELFVAWSAGYDCV